MKPWFSLKRSVLLGSLIVTNALLACGNVDPADNMQQAGSGGAGASAGAGGGAVGAEGGGEPGAGSTGEAGAPNMPPEGVLLPWAPGNTWTYRVTQAGVVTEKTTTVGDETEVGGTGPNAEVLAFHVVTAKGANSADRTESWQAPDPENPDRILRYREQSFGAMTGMLELEEHWDPPKIHIDGSADRTVAGANWLEIYTETKLPVGLTPTMKETRDRWIVIADDETVEVPVGTFENAVHIQKTGNSAKEYWYVRGVGKVKETGSQTEELVDYTIVSDRP